MTDDRQVVTALLGRWRAGEQDALDEIVPLVYGELRRLANAQLRREGNPTIQPTELVAEAYLRLVDVHSIDWQSRAHFFSMAARTMRRVLVDRFRRKKAARRGAGAPVLTFQEADGTGQRELDLDRLDDALTELEHLDARQAEVVTLRFFGGMKVEEIAQALDVSARTVKREWAAARLWLHQELVS